MTTNGTGSTHVSYNCLSSFLVGLFNFELPRPSMRKQLTLETGFLYLIVPNLLNYLLAYLVLVPGTRPLRLAILPIALWTAYKGATALDVTIGHNEPGLGYLNHGVFLSSILLGMRNITWALVEHPYRRVVSQSQGAVAKRDSQFQSVGPYPFRDAFELTLNLRGLGWDWSYGLYVPTDWRNTSSRTIFTLQTVASCVVQNVLSDLAYYGAQIYSIKRYPLGRDIYDPSLTLGQQFIRSNIIVFLFAFTIYCSIAVPYDLATIVGVQVFRQDPTSWPPLFGAVWSATSLKELWSKRWHQHLRYNLIQIGAKPFGLLFGRTFSVVGAFLLSGIIHNLGVWTVGNGDEFGTLGGFFLVMALLIIAEGLWTKVTGKRVGGLFGWLWVMGSLITCAHFILDAYARLGLLESVFMPRAQRPSSFIFGPSPV